MKNLISFLSIICLSFISFGQLSDTTQLTTNTVNGCGEALFQLYGYYSNNDEPKAFHIDFGNNQDTTLYSDSSNYYVNNFIETTYPYSGNYTILITVETSSGVLIDQQSFDFLIEGAENCGQEIIYKVHNDYSNQYFLSDTVPLDFTGSDGITHTIYPTANSINQYLTNSMLYPAQITTNPGWLTSHNSVQLNPAVQFSSPGYLLPEFNYGLGWPTLIISRTDVVNENNLLFLWSSFSYVSEAASNCYLNFNNTVDAIPDSIKRIRVEYDPLLQIDHDSLLNISEGSGFLEFDIVYNNLYRSIRFGLTTNTVQSADSIYFKCFFLNNMDLNAVDDTTTLYLESIDPCFGLHDSVLNVSLNSFSFFQNNGVVSNVNLSKNTCPAVDSIELIVHHSPSLVLNATNSLPQFTILNDSTLFSYVSIPDYAASSNLQLSFSLEELISGEVYVNYAINFLDSNLNDNLASDTIHIPFCDSVDFTITALSTVMIAPTQSGNCSISPLLPASCQLSDTTEILITFPGYVTMDASALTLGTFTDSTFRLLVDWTNQSNYFQLLFHIPGNIPSGTPYTIVSRIVNSHDTDTSNNEFIYNGIVLNSYDPNEKRSSLPETIHPDTLDKLTYTIHFQNDGNLEAHNIVVRDTISPNLDLSTFRFLGSSHPCEVYIDETSREVTFTFQEIMLSPSVTDLLESQGIFSYEISELPNLPVGTEIKNSAYIYFDFNPAIVTNTTYNINQTTLGLSGNSIEQIGMYPNPAKDKLQFSGASVKEITVYDLTGKVVLTARDLDSNEISLSTVQTGIYQVVLKTETGSSTQKLVIQK